MLESMEQEVCCPYCGEWIVLVVDGAVSRQIYTEDCSVLLLSHGNLRDD